MQGDSGGPDWAWINNTELPGWRLIGIHSVGGDCAVDMSTSMGTAEFRDWIISCAGNDQCD